MSGTYPPTVPTAVPVPTPATTCTVCHRPAVPTPGRPGVPAHTGFDVWFAACLVVALVITGALFLLAGRRGRR